MSNFIKNENADWQREVREKIEDLTDTLDISNVEWDAWEREFIESMSEKLGQEIINVSTKQYTRIWELWEKI